MPRKKPFSIKQKKLQLREKRDKKRRKGTDVPKPASEGMSLDSSTSDLSSVDTDNEDRNPPSLNHPAPMADISRDESSGPVFVDRLNQQPKGCVAGEGKYDQNRYKLHFEKETTEEVERRKLIAKRNPIIPVGESDMEVGVEDIYQPGSVLDIPRRPPWNYSMSKEVVERQEEVMFESYLNAIYTNYKTKNLSYFEHNLETWRQLWRVFEISDIILLITDVRHPALHFSPALYNYVIKDLKKNIVLVLNKVDLVPPQVAVAWRHYFLSKFPHLSVICFTSFPDQDVSTEPSKKIHLKFRRKGRKLMSAVGPRQLFHVVEEIYRGKVDLDGWQEHIIDHTTGDPFKESMLTATAAAVGSGDSGSEDESVESSVALEMTEMTSNPLIKDNVNDGVLTIGMVGHPNVGKSSIINGLLGKKVVSTSRTPGHTKHFQTIFLTKSVRLCDCPGLVFPSLVHKQLQILSGIYPIAQVREPYTVVGYIVQRVPLVELLQLQHPLTVETAAKKTSRRRAGDIELDLDDPNTTPLIETADEVYHTWTAWDICDAWAEKRGYYTAKSARLDTYRAANSLLRLAVDGRISLHFKPPDYTRDRGSWEAHHEVSEMIELQQMGMSHKQWSLTSESTLPLCNDHLSDDSDSQISPANPQNYDAMANKFAGLMYLSDN